MQNVTHNLSHPFASNGLLNTQAENGPCELVFSGQQQFLRTGVFLCKVYKSQFVSYFLIFLHCAIVKPLFTYSSACTLSEDGRAIERLCFAAAVFKMVLEKESKH